MDLNGDISGNCAAGNFETFIIGPSLILDLMFRDVGHSLSRLLNELHLIYQSGAQSMIFRENEL